MLTLAHLALLPLWLLLWTLMPALIRLGDRWPIFSKQEGAGKGGRAFTIRKFCTMAPDADRRGPLWTRAADLRVTPSGRLLRRTALDELPEVLSIWKGGMSLVGPRALDVKEQAELERSIPGFGQRLRVRPGLTGQAQVQDRTDDAYQKFRYVTGYLHRMSPWLDLHLLVVSVWNTLAARWDQQSGKPAEEGAEPVTLNTGLSPRTFPGATTVEGRGAIGAMAGGWP